MMLNNLKLDEQGRPIKMPDCANPNCDGKGWVLVGTLLYCGKCYNKFQKIQQQNIINIMEKV